jgi:hypothetical protein
VQVQAYIDNNSHVYTSRTILTQQLQSFEALELNNITQRQQQDSRKPRTVQNHPTDPLHIDPVHQLTKQTLSHKVGNIHL